MRLAKALTEKMHDVRLVDKLIHEGKLTQEIQEKFLKALDDSTENMTFTEDEKKESSEEPSTEE